MERVAAISGIEALKRRCRVLVYTDSEYLRKGITEWLAQWQARGWRTAAKKAVKNEDLWRELAMLAASHEIEWHWVKGHSGHPGNDRADRLANLGVDDLLSAQRMEQPPQKYQEF